MFKGFVLIDTSAWIHALRPAGLPNIREQVRALLLEGRASTCEMIILELANGTRTMKEHTQLCEDLEALRQFPITESVWKQAYQLAYLLRSKGVSLPATDQLIASVALINSCALLHYDKHFELIAQYTTLNVSF